MPPHKLHRCTYKYVCVRERESCLTWSVFCCCRARCFQRADSMRSAASSATIRASFCSTSPSLLRTLHAQGIDLLGGGFTLFENAVLARSVRKDPNPRFCKIPFTVDALACALGIRLVHFELFPAGVTGLLPAFSLLVTHLGGFDGNSSQVILKQVIILRWIGPLLVGTC